MTDKAIQTDFGHFGWENKVCKELVCIITSRAVGRALKILESENDGFGEKDDRSCYSFTINASPSILEESKLKK